MTCVYKYILPFNNLWVYNSVHSQFLLPLVPSKLQSFYEFAYLIFDTICRIIQYLCFCFQFFFCSGTGIMSNLYLTLEEPPNYFSQGWRHFIFLPAVYEGSNFSTSLSTFIFHFKIITILLVWNNWPHCGFDLHFPHD